MNGLLTDPNSWPHRSPEYHNAEKVEYERSTGMLNVTTGRATHERNLKRQKDREAEYTERNCPFALPPTHVTPLTRNMRKRTESVRHHEGRSVENHLRDRFPVVHDDPRVR